MTNEIKIRMTKNLAKKLDNFIFLYLTEVSFFSVAANEGDTNCSSWFIAKANATDKASCSTCFKVEDDIGLLSIEFDKERG